MTAPVSVVIPTLNVAHIIGPTLACIYEGLSASLICEVIFADGGSTDGIETIAKDSGAKFIKAPKGRGSQLRAGADQAKGRWILFIHADTILSSDWFTKMGDHINHETSAGYCNVSFDTEGFAPRCIARCANLRSRFLNLPYGDQGLLISQLLYRKSGGYPDIPLMEDVALVRKLKGNLKALPITATTRSDRFVKDGWYNRSCKNLSILALYFMGVSPVKLAKRYQR